MCQSPSRHSTVRSRRLLALSASRSRSISVPSRDLQDAPISQRVEGTAARGRVAPWESRLRHGRGGRADDVEQVRALSKRYPLHTVCAYCVKGEADDRVAPIASDQTAQCDDRLIQMIELEDVVGAAVPDLEGGIHVTCAHGTGKTSTTQPLIRSAPVPFRMPQWPRLPERSSTCVGISRTATYRRFGFFEARRVTAARSSQTETSSA